jgi:hypothetical protein
MVSTLRYTADRECRRIILLARNRASRAGLMRARFTMSAVSRGVVVVDDDLNFVEQRMRRLPLDRA